MQDRLTVSKKVLNWIIGQLDVNHVDEEISKLIFAWYNGVKCPTFNQVEKVSKAIGIPLGYFFLEEAPSEDLSIVEYRTVESSGTEKLSRNLIEILHDMEQIQDWMRLNMIKNNESPCEIVGQLAQETDVYRFAKIIRSTLNIEINWYDKLSRDDTPFKYIRDRISAVGITIMMSGIVGNNTHRPLDVEEFRAFTLIDDYAPLIFINANDSISGRLFSLLHELAHICIGTSSIFNDYCNYSFNQVNQLETLCNSIAAEILVPHDNFIAEWRQLSETTSVDAIISRLAIKFKCSTTVIARKALDFTFIDFSLYSQIAQKAISDFFEYRKKNNGGGNYYRTMANRIDHRFLGRLVSSVSRGETLYSDAFRLTNTNRSTFATLIETVGGGK